MADTATTADVAQIVGETDVARRSTIVDPDGWVSATEATHTQLLASASAVRTMRPLEGLLVYGSPSPRRDSDCASD